MKKLVRKFTGKNVSTEDSARASISEGEPAVSTEMSAPAPVSPPNHYPASGTTRRPRRPKETVDVNYADYAPFAPAPPSSAPPTTVAPTQQQQLQLAIELAKQLAAATAEMGAAPQPIHHPQELSPQAPQHVPEQEVTAAQHGQQEEAHRQAAYQAELDAVLAESVQQAEYDHVLREIKLWRLDLSGALGDVAAAQREAQRRREEIDAQLATASPDDEQGWQQVMRLSASHAEVEGKLQDLGGRLHPIRDAVRSLQDLDAYIRADQPSVEEACCSLDRIIAQLLEALNMAGLTFHHPVAPVWGQGGEKPGGEVPGRESKPGDPLRELVHSLIEQSRRVAPTPPTASADGTEEEEEEGEPSQPPSPPQEPASVQEPPSPPEDVPAPVAESSEGQGGECVTPRVTSGGQPGSTPSSSSRLRNGTPSSSGGGGRRRGSGAKPSPEDSIKRMARVVALYNELQKGVVAEAVGWAQTKPGGSSGSGLANPTGFPGASSGGRNAPRTFTPAITPTRLPPATSKGQAEGEEEDAEEKGEGEAPALPLPSPADLSRLAADVEGFQPGALQETCEFVERVLQQGVPRGGVSGREGGGQALSEMGWPREKWGALCDAARVAGRLRDMGAELSAWSVDVQVGTIAESHRLASLVDRASREVGRVSYVHDPLRQRMAKAGIPWDGHLLSELRWAAQHAAAQLMHHALAEAKELSRSKKWQAQAILQPLGHAAMAVFKVHQMCGGLAQETTLLFEELQERTTHYARLIDHQWLRNTKWA